MTTFAITLAASCASRRSLLVLAGASAAFAGASSWALVGFASLALASALTITNRRSPYVAAVVGALGAQVLLHLPSIWFFGFPSIVAGLAFSTIGVSGYRQASQGQRRRARSAIVGVLTIAAAGVAIGAVPMIDARGDARIGVNAANRAITAIRNGDPEGGSQHLLRSRAALDAASEKIHSPLTTGLRFIPIIAQHYRAIAQAAEVGASVSTESSIMVEDLLAVEQSIATSPPDLELIQSIALRLEHAVATLAHGSDSLGEADSPWLIPPARSLLNNFAMDIDEMLPTLEKAAEAAAVLPPMLGATTAQSYLIFFGTPAESREMGGFVGSWATISVDAGSIDLIDSGRKTDLYPVANATSLDTADSLPWFLEMARPTEYPENLTSSPDPRFVADMTRRVLGRSGSGVGFDFDGIIYIDAVAIIDLLRLTGPVDLGEGRTLTSQNAPDFFFRDQYQFVSDDRTDLFESLSDVAGQVLDKLSTVALPGPEELGSILGPAARGGHIQVVTFDEQENEFLESVELLRNFEERETSDLVALIQANGLPNKMDLYLTRSLDYRATLSDDAVLRATATATLQSNPPADAPAYTLGAAPDTGTNRVFLSLYSPHVLTGVRVNGSPVTFRQTTEFGLNRYLVQVDVPPTNEPYEIVYDLVGNHQPGEPYSVEVWRQALINIDQVAVSYDGPDGSIDWSGPLKENQVLLAEPVAG